MTDIIPSDGTDSDELLRLAASLEQKSEHPIAGAVMRTATERGIVPGDVSEFSSLSGSGISAVLDGRKLIGGSVKYISSLVNTDGETIRTAERLADEGKTPMLFAADDGIIGLIAVADTIRNDSAAAVKTLKDMGLRVVMLTGDNIRTASVIGKQAGVDEVIAGVLPEGKALAVKLLSECGRTAMAGDGINDAPALTRADTGIAIGAGTDIAIESADVVLMRSSLADVPAAISLSRSVLRNIKENLFWAFIYNIIGIPLAAGVWIPVFGWTLSPMFGAAAMSLSSFCVVTNALRLNLADIHKTRRISTQADITGVADRFREMTSKRTVTAVIEGMMCHHCEKRVQKALEALECVESASADFEKGTAVITLCGEYDEDMIRKAVEDADYKVTDITADDIRR